MTYTISVGSNFQPERNIKKAFGLLSFTFGSMRESPLINTLPVAMDNNRIFKNGLLEFESEESPQTVKSILKSIESQLRDNNSKSNGIVEIDLDIILIDGKIVHTDYYTYPHIKELLKSLEN